jgi:glycosyltransferase involved in cell wall biosynthesis
MRAESLPKVVHFSTSHTGGAGIAARNLNAALNKAGFDSAFLALDNENFIPAANEFAISRNRNQQLIGAASSLFHKYLYNETYFTLGSISALNSAQVKELVPQNSIIHIHNWFNLIDFDLLDELLGYGYKVVFTLHDMRVLTGGCHYSLNCLNYLADCSNCPYLPKGLQGFPKRILKETRSFFAGHDKQIFFIAPSRWLSDVAISSKLIPESHIKFIPNVHHFERIENRNQPQQILRSDKRVLNIGIASLDAKSKLKGGDLLEATSLELASGGVKFEFLSEYVSSGCGQDAFWAGIDYLLVASRADNSPNVIHEAKLRNIPVIGTKIGGITELLNLDFDIGIDEFQLNSAHLIGIFNSLLPNLGEFRPRFVDQRYYHYVHHALETTISTYKKIVD